jgi:hypothetical protein
MTDNIKDSPFNYCDSASNDVPSCDFNDLTPISFQKNEREADTRYSYLNTEERVYQCLKCHGFWKNSVDMYNREIWLKVGENSDQKYIERNQEDFQNKKLNHFPLTFFRITEALKHGMVLNCGVLGSIDNYHGLSCAPKNLREIKKVSFNEAIGNHVKIDIFKCKSCGTYYKIREEYDSHHGTNLVCIQLNERKELLFGEVLEFKQNEIECC